MGGIQKMDYDLPGFWRNHEMREILARCGFSDEMTKYLSSEGAISTNGLVDAICRAPITLDEKAALLTDMKKSLSSRDEPIETIISNRCRSLQEVKDALLLAGNGGFYSAMILFTEWYDIDEFRLESESCGVFTSLEAVEKYIINEEFDNELDEGYYRIEAWDVTDTTWKRPRYDYYYYKGKPCWYEKLLPEKQEHGNTYYLTDDRKFAAGDLDLDLKTPYIPGDIVHIDCRPFGPALHAMILEARNQWDCCFPNIVFCYPATDEWVVTPLKHKRLYKDMGHNTYEPMLSPLYRLRRVKDKELTEEDARLIKLSSIIRGDEEKASKVWETWNKIEDASLSWEKVMEVFEVIC